MEKVFSLVCLSFWEEFCADKKIFREQRDGGNTVILLWEVL